MDNTVDKVTEIKQARTRRNGAHADYYGTGTGEQVNGAGKTGHNVSTLSKRQAKRQRVR
jgi:hypothetical protein